MDNVLRVVVDDLEAATTFFAELGMELEGGTTFEGPSVDRLIGLQNVRTRTRIGSPTSAVRRALSSGWTNSLKNLTPKKNLKEK